MDVKLDWQFNENGFEAPNRRPAAGFAPAGAPPVPPGVVLERNPPLVRLWLRSRFTEGDHGQLYLLAAFGVFGSLILFCLVI